jgi:hypothetical protein
VKVLTVFPSELIWCIWVSSRRRRVRRVVGTGGPCGPRVTIVVRTARSVDHAVAKA